GEVRRLPVHVEGGVVLVLLVEDEEVRILGRAMWAIDQASPLGLLPRGDLLLQQRGEGVALALGRPDLRDDSEHVRHVMSPYVRVWDQAPARRGTPPPH